MGSAGKAMYTASGKIEQQDLVREYLPMVRRQALAMKVKLPDSIDVDDLVQAGMVGLLDARGRFDPSAGVDFSAFARQRVRGAMLDELRTRDWLPRSVRRSARAMETCIRRLEQQLQRAPEEREIAAELGMELEDYRQLLSDTNNGFLLPFEDLISEEGEAAASGDVQSRPFEALFDAERKQHLVAAIEALPEREQQLMALYYQEELNLREIGEVLGVTESRVCQLHSQALKRLRTRMAALD